MSGSDEISGDSDWPKANDPLQAMKAADKNGEVFPNHRVGIREMEVNGLRITTGKNGEV